MCNPIDQKIADALNKTVIECLDNAEMFTGYIITIRTRERLNIKLRHKDVRGNIHDLPALRNAIEYGHDKDNETMPWDVCQVSIPNSSETPPFVYYREGQDPQTYQFLDRAGNKVQGQGTVQPTPQASITATAPAADADSETLALTKGGKNSDGTFSPDSYKRLWIPIQFMQQAGMNPGDDCYVVADPDQNIIYLMADTTQIQQGGMSITTKTVEKHKGGVCLRTKTLDAADLAANNKFVIENGDCQSTKAVKVTAS